MNVLFCLSDASLTHYRRQCTGERLGWIIHKSDATFVPVHRVLAHPEDGPVIIIGDEVLEVDPDLFAVYATEDDARDAYYRQR